MTDNLLNAPERGAIEDFLQRSNVKSEEKTTYERVLGFLSGVVITPGRFMPSDWLQPLLDLNEIVFDDIDDANRFMGALMPLYNRVNAIRIREENLCPFDLRVVAESDSGRKLVTDWAIGLHGALTLRPEIWGAEEHEAWHVPKKLLEEVQATIPFLWALAEPHSIPEIVPDPIHFQRNFLSQGPGWSEDMLRETWDDELIDLFSLFCLGRLKATTDVLQSYARAYDRRPPARPAPAPILGPRNKIGRNDPCPCGSGKKFKKCCGA